MPEPAVPTADANGSAPEGEASIHPRSDLKDGLGWMALGVAILVGSITMDRLEQQHINPYTVPGLLPGLLGIAMILLGGILALRSWRRGALRLAPPAPTADQLEERVVGFWNAVELAGYDAGDQGVGGCGPKT